MTPDESLVANSATHTGGAASAEFSASITITNSILYRNIAPNGSQLVIDGPDNVITLRDSNVEGGVAGILVVAPGVLNAGPGIIDADPLFRDLLGPDGMAATREDNDYSLGAGSPSIDAGDVAAIPMDRFDLDRDGDDTEGVPFDLLGNARRVDDPAVPDTGSGGAPVVDHGPTEG